MFKFTFSSGSAIFNPFAAKAEEEERIQQSLAPQTITRKLPAPPKRTSPPPSISEDIQPSRKRGWAPTISLASAATSQPTLTNGWIDTPSRYLEAASQSHRGGGADEDDVDAGEFIMAIVYLRVPMSLAIQSRSSNNNLPQIFKLVILSRSAHSLLSSC
jgi:hypothetical protein